MKVSVVCPAYSHGYNASFLESINLTSRTYKKGDWIGNSNKDEKIIFSKATYGIESGEGGTIIHLHDTYYSQL